VKGVIHQECGECVCQFQATDPREPKSTESSVCSSPKKIFSKYSQSGFYDDNGNKFYSDKAIRRQEEVEAAALPDGSLTKHDDIVEVGANSYIRFKVKLIKRGRVVTLSTKITSFRMRSGEPSYKPSQLASINADLSPSLDMEDPEGSWVERSSILINELSPMVYTTGKITTREIVKVFVLMLKNCERVDRIR